MKNWKAWSVGLAVAVMATGCASNAHVEKADDADFSRYKSFAWMDKSGDEKTKVNDIIEQKIRVAVNKELAKSGWKEVKHRPDVILNYDVLVERNIKESSNPVYSRPYSRVVYNPYTRRYTTIYYPSQFMGYERDERPIKEGTVTITMIDARTDKAVWQGWTTEEVNGKNLTSKEIQNS